MFLLFPPDLDYGRHRPGWAGGVGRVLTEQLVSFNYPAVSSTLIIFILLIFGVDVISGAVRRAYR